MNKMKEPLAADFGFLRWPAVDRMVAPKPAIRKRPILCFL
jgi:hypothetical protein